jgi:hypothetical protein
MLPDHSRFAHAGWDTPTFNDNRVREAMLQTPAKERELICRTEKRGFIKITEAYRRGRSPLKISRQSRQSNDKERLTTRNQKP